MDPSNTRTLQFELWHECNNLCTFCFLSSEKRDTPDDIKIQHLKSTLATISDMSNYPKYNCIGYIGGEFFQGQLANPDVKHAFYELMEKTAELYNSGIIKQVWITATLTIGHQKDLYEILKLFKNHKEVWILTSWDTMGRFKTPKYLNNWEYHVKRLKEVFPDIKINVTTILTGDLIDKYMNDKFNFHQMSKKYDIYWFFKHAGSFIPWKTSGNYQEARSCKKKCNEILPNFFPTRKAFIRFLTKFKEQEPSDLWARLYNIKLRADTLVRNFNNGDSLISQRFKNAKLDVSEQRAMECGHTFVYSAYIDCDDCVLCDTQRIAEFDN